MATEQVTEDAANIALMIKLDAEIDKRVAQAIHNIFSHNSSYNDYNIMIKTNPTNNYEEHAARAIFVAMANNVNVQVLFHGLYATDAIINTIRCKLGP